MWREIVDVFWPIAQSGVWRRVLRRKKMISGSSHYEVCNNEGSFSFRYLLKVTFVHELGERMYYGDWVNSDEDCHWSFQIFDTTTSARHLMRLMFLLRIEEMIVAKIQRSGEAWCDDRNTSNWSKVDPRGLRWNGTTSNAASSTIGTFSSIESSDHCSLESCLGTTVFRHGRQSNLISKTTIIFLMVQYSK